MVFHNCGRENNQESCHFSCLECDGPTQSDCLSCDPSKNRIYNEKQKACFCPYGTIDLDEECKDYSALQFNISQEKKEEFKCSYGNFEFEDECWKCPSKIRDKLITCIECITNPKTWQKNPYCQYNFVTDNNERPFTKLDQGVEMFFFDGTDIKLSESQENHLDIYSDYIKTFDHFSNFCQNCQKDITKKFCFIFEHCEQCQILQSKAICTKCAMNYQLKDDNCNTQKLIQSTKIIKCETPYYQTHYNVCILCLIENCLYCFDYLKDDVTQNTIFYKQSYQRFNTIEKQVLVGCAQCLQGYIYDFTIGQCSYQQPQIQNCLRSFLNQEGTELCILSSINDFTVAPQILNCEHLIFNCKQCYKSIHTNIKCLICHEGFVASFTSGFCDYRGQLIGQSYVSYYDENIWRYLVQSFTMLFTQINYSEERQTSRIFDIECQDGYSLSNGKCLKYCDQNCQKCQKKEGQSFTCALCSLNSYQEFYRVQQDGKCIVCPSLCQMPNKIQ